MDVLIQIWRPTPIVGRSSDHQCAFQVVGLADDARSAAVGSDAMQAIFLAMRGVDSVLNPWRDALTWYDWKYEDPALFPNVLDAGRRRRIHAIIDEEIYAIETRRRERREFQEQRCAQAAKTERGASTS